jgi:hypothetical protein
VRRRRSIDWCLRAAGVAAAVAVLAVAGESSALAQVTPAGGTAAGDDTQPASSRVGAVIFYDYTYQSSPKVADTAGNQISPSSFNVARAYLNVTGNISHIVSYRITPDINSTRFNQTGGNNFNGSLVFRLKYAYAQMALTDWTGQWTQSYVRAGVQQTPFIDYQESVYRYRWQGTVFAERDGGMSSADAGVSFHSNIPNNYGDFHVGFYSGEGYNGLEPNDQKALMVRGTLRPMPTGSAIARGIRVTGFYFGDHYLKGYERKRIVGSVALEQRHYNVSFDYLKRKDQGQTPPNNATTESDGYSFFITPFFQEKGNGWEALVRYDSFRADSKNISNRRQNRTIAGIAYWFPHPGGNGTAALMLDYEGIRFKNPSATQVKQNRIILHGLINF